jgi:hypothetical protein
MNYNNNKRHFNRKFTVTAFALLLTLAVLFAACTPVVKSAADSGSGGGQVSSGDGSGDASAPEATDAEEPEKAAAPLADNKAEDIVIPIESITTNATFYPATVNGIDLEVIAVEAPDGTIRTAFNTCQVCYDSGKGYYKQDGDVLVCQNCGNRFPMSHVEVESGGCNPWPIFDEYKTVTDTDITIPAAFLAEATVIFENWKRNY